MQMCVLLVGAVVHRIHADGEGGRNQQCVRSQVVPVAAVSNSYVARATLLLDARLHAMMGSVGSRRVLVRPAWQAESHPRARHGFDNLH